MRFLSLACLVFVILTSPAYAFLPTSLSGLTLWLDASDTATITQSGGLVSQWNDKSANAYNATAATTARPTTGTRTINSLNTLDFNGTTNSMILPSGIYSISNGANTAFEVFAPDLTSTLDEIIEASASGTKRYRTVLASSAGPAFVFTNRSGNSTGGSISYIADTNTHISGFKYDGSATVTGWMDGSLTATGGSQSVFTATDANIGSFQGTASFSNGRIAEIIIYNRALSIRETNLVGQYLGNKWAAPWTNIYDPSINILGVLE